MSIQSKSHCIYRIVVLAYSNHSIIAPIATCVHKVEASEHLSKSLVVHAPRHMHAQAIEMQLQSSWVSPQMFRVRHLWKRLPRFGMTSVMAQLHLPTKGTSSTKSCFALQKLFVKCRGLFVADHHIVRCCSHLPVFFLELCQGVKQFPNLTSDLCEALERSCNAIHSPLRNRVFLNGAKMITINQDGTKGRLLTRFVASDAMLNVRRGIVGLQKDFGSGHQAILSATRTLGCKQC